MKIQIAVIMKNVQNTALYAERVAVISSRKLRLVMEKPIIMGATSLAMLKNYSYFKT